MIKDAILNISQKSKNKIFTPNCTAFNTSLTAWVYLQMSLVTAVHKKAFKVLPKKKSITNMVPNLVSVFNVYIIFIHK